MIRELISASHSDFVCRNQSLLRLKQQQDKSGWNHGNYVYRPRHCVTVVPGIFVFMQRKIKGNGDANLFEIDIGRRFDEQRE